MTHEELRKLAEAATPGDWHTTGNGTVYVLGYDGTNRVSASFQAGFISSPSHDEIRTPEAELEANAAYIAAANPKTVLELLDRIAELEGLLSEYDEDWDTLEVAEKAPTPISLELAKAQAEQCEAVGHSVFWRDIRTVFNSVAAVKSASGEWIGTIGLDGRFIPNYSHSVTP